MRVTSSIYYENLYGSTSSKLNRKLFDVNRQIASGLSIEYAKDDVSKFTETMRLDNEINALAEVKKSTESGYKFSNQTDTVLNEFDSSINRLRTLLINAANETNDETSRNAIASEMRGIESNLKTLANTSIDGKFLFAGSSVDIKPIDENGVYHGNDKTMNAFLGSHNQQPYNITGQELFLGEEKTVRKSVTSNVQHKNIIHEYPELKSSKDDGKSLVLDEKSTIRELMGDTDNVVDTTNEKHFFYLRGTTSDGVAFHKKIKLKDDDTIGQLLKQIGDAYGNQPNLKLVDVSINDAGEISVLDKRQGSSKLDFHLVGAVDFSGGSKADVTDISDLADGETNFKEIMNPTNPPAKDLFVKEFVKSPFQGVDPTTSKIGGLLYDDVYFSKKGSTLSSNVPQIKKVDNGFADATTKISEVADLSQNGNGSLDGTSFVLKGKDINGQSYDATIDLKSSGSTFSVNGKTYDIYDMGEIRKAVPADEMTYQQLTDVINMVVTGKLPQQSTPQEYDRAIYESKFNGNTYVSDDGLIKFDELNTTTTQATLSLYDKSSGSFGENDTSSALTFQANNALTINDAKTDFFQTIDKVISSVENYQNYPNGGADGNRNVGMENAISMLDDLQDHLLRVHSKVGSQSNILSRSLERTQLLEVSTKTLRSSVVDTDLAEASLKMQQLTTNYNAMLSTVNKVSKLSLVNYL